MLRYSRYFSVTDKKISSSLTLCMTQDPKWLKMCDRLADCASSLSVKHRASDLSIPTQPNRQEELLIGCWHISQVASDV